MPDTMAVVALLAIAGIGGAILGYLARRVLTATKIRTAESYAERLVADARAQQKEIILEGKDEVLQAQRAAEEEARERRTDFQRQERLLLDRSESLDRKSEALERREALAEERLAELDTQISLQVRQRQLDLDSARAEITPANEAVASATEARRVVQARFQAGVATSSDLLDAQQDLLEAELGRTRSLAQVRLAEAQLARALGL